MDTSFADRLAAMAGWTPPPTWSTLTAIDAHTEGEPLRVIVSGYPALVGETILARRRHAKAHLDHLRTALMWEPRGHADMYGCLVVPPVTPDADFGVLFLHNEGYSTMCGHGIIAVTKVVLEAGLLPLRAPETRVGIDTPAGLVTAFARVHHGRVTSVYFHNVPSFVVALDESVDVPGLGTVRYDLAFGGAFYAYVQAADVGLTCTPDDFRRLIEHGRAIKHAVMASRAIEHPFEEDLNFLYGTIFIGPPAQAGAHSRNVCIFAEGEVDRSPTGTGISARAAIHYARGEIGLGEPIVIESIIGSSFTVGVKATTTFGPHAAVIPRSRRPSVHHRDQYVLPRTRTIRYGAGLSCAEATRSTALPFPVQTKPMSTIRVLSRADAQQALDMKSAIALMHDAFIALSEGRATVPVRVNIPVSEEGGRALFMPVYAPSYQQFGLKVVSIHPNNHALGLPAIHALVMVSDATTGRPLAVMDGEYITALRTGAGAGLATDLLARPDATVAALFGAGVQARTQLEAVCAVRPIRQAYVFNRTRAHADAFAQEMSLRLGIDVEVAEDPALLRRADVVCTATTALGPVFAHANLKPGVHINGIGSYRPDMAEIPPETVLAAKVVVDHRPACLAEAGRPLATLEPRLDHRSPHPRRAWRGRCRAPPRAYIRHRDHLLQIGR